MKQLSNRTIAIISLIAIAVLALGVFVLQNRPQELEVVEEGNDSSRAESEYPSEYARLLAEMEAERESRNKTPEEQEAYAKMIEEERQKEREAIQELYTNADEKIKTGELVWYDIPELGVRFKVSPEVKNELVYKNVTLSRGLEEGESGKTALVSFSTKTLESISESCSAEDGPVGVISRRVGPPSNPIAPCGSGQKIKEFSGGYFCYTHSQALCTWTDEDYEEYEREPVMKYNHIFTSEEFWAAAEVK